MDGVYNRKLFAKKSQEARNTLRDMGGVPPMQPKIGGIMASSPELMQAVAMRRPVVLPTTEAPVAPTPAPQPQPQMLPPSSPLPNVAGIPSTAPAPRPVAKKPGIAKFQEGGGIKAALTPQQRLVKGVTDFSKAFQFGQKAITTEDPAKLGLPEGANMGGAAKMLEDPEATAASIISETVPKDQQTGNTKTDLRKAATMTGIERVPAEAEVDELNKAIFGAKLAGAIAGNYVDPNTGQALRPTAGARIANAAVEGLAVVRETETRRAEQEAELAKARIAAAARSTKAPKLPEPQKRLLDLFEERAKTEDPDAVAAKFNETIAPGVGDTLLEYYRSAFGLGPSTPSANVGPSTPSANVPKAGTVMDGYEFQGGNPADKDNWTKVE